MGAQVATREELIALLGEAERAYHELAIGIAPKVIVHQNGQRTEYNSTTSAKLKTYITELKGQIYGPSPVGPMRVWF